MRHSNNSQHRFTFSHSFSLNNMINRFILSLAALSSAASVAMAADSVTLKNGNSLSGKLVNSSASGVLELKHPHSQDTLKIKETSIDRIVFDTRGHKNSTLTQSIQLLNGDHFPCTITELNDQIVSFKSDSVGAHTVPRNKVSHIKFNTKANKILYRGPGDDLSAWTTSSEDWKLKDGKLSVNRRSEAGKSIRDLTQNYIFEFKTTWEEATPHLRFCFSSNQLKADKKSDFYYIDLNSHGITIYRSNKGKYTTLAQVLGNDSFYAQSNLNVAIHVDRKHQKMALYLNGKLIKTLNDTKVAPKGNYFIVKNLQRTGINTQISNIKISSWSGKVTDDIKSKTEALAKHDLITDLSGSVMTGQIIGITRNEGKANLNFKAPFAKKDSSIPETAIDILEFKTAAKATDKNNAIYHLNLVSGGQVSYNSSQIIDGKLTVDHPILGKVSLPKASLSSAITIPKPIDPKSIAPFED